MSSYVAEVNALFTYGHLVSSYTVLIVLLFVHLCVRVVGWFFFLFFLLFSVG